jgi:hypothetical protein
MRVYIGSRFLTSHDLRCGSVSGSYIIEQNIFFAFNAVDDERRSKVGNGRLSQSPPTLSQFTPKFSQNSGFQATLARAGVFTSSLIYGTI